MTCCETPCAAQRAVPALDLRQRRPLDLQLEIAVQRVPAVMSASVSASAQQIRPALQQPIRVSRNALTQRAVSPDRRPVSLVLRRSIKSPEHAVEEIRLQRGLRPIHPAVDAQRERPDRRTRMTRRHDARRDSAGWRAIPRPCASPSRSRARGHADSSPGTPGASSPPNLPPASICSCSSASSPISHMTFWTLNELRRPQTSAFSCSTAFQSQLALHLARRSASRQQARAVKAATGRLDEDSWRAGDRLGRCCGRLRPRRRIFRPNRSG